MSAEELAGTLRQALLALGVLFVIVNLRVSYELLAWWRLRRDVVLTWPPPKPPFFAINLAIGVMLGVILLVTAYRMPESVSSLFGLAMMFTYYGTCCRSRFASSADSTVTGSGPTAATCRTATLAA